MQKDDSIEERAKRRKGFFQGVSRLLHSVQRDFDGVEPGAHAGPAAAHARGCFCSGRTRGARARLIGPARVAYAQELLESNQCSVTRQQALDYFHSPDLIGLGFEADAVRRRLHPEGVVTYIIDRNINYTNFCTEYCTFCAFYRPLPKNGKRDPRSDEGYILEFETIYDKIAETLEMGGTGVLMQGGIHPDLKIDWFERLFTGIKQRFP